MLAAIEAGRLCLVATVAFVGPRKRGALKNVLNAALLSSQANYPAFLLLCDAATFGDKLLGSA